MLVSSRHVRIHALYCVVIDTLCYAEIRSDFRKWSVCAPCNCTFLCVVTVNPSEAIRAKTKERTITDVGQAGAPILTLVYLTEITCKQEHNSAQANVAGETPYASRAVPATDQGFKMKSDLEENAIAGLLHLQSYPHCFVCFPDPVAQWPNCLYRAGRTNRARHGAPQVRKQKIRAQKSSHEAACPAPSLTMSVAQHSHRLVSISTKVHTKKHISAVSTERCTALFRLYTGAGRFQVSNC